ncbi:hypothetical protein [Cupriavidus sp. UYPR2.512]|uniref:hypothetical protein n=1 Tax=Cupriavidus sp. UYPR2.512 TaxID=1080187 RepID=UPI000368A706|nr:hypothetical protein [Cupriavidus sp. UYPR2.512]UIF90869.1 hypothetical protein KAF44_32290 [Cupriavidus necator]
MSDEAQMQAHELRIRAVEGAVEKIADSMQQLVRLEERHAETRLGLDRAFVAIERRKEENERLAERVAKIERDMPGLIESRKWMVMGILATIGFVGVGLLALVVKH